LADPTLAKNVGELAARKRVYARADDAKRNRLRSHSDSVSMDAYHRLSEDNDRLREELRKQKANSAILHTARKHAEESLSTVPSFLSRLSQDDISAIDTEIYSSSLTDNGALTCADVADLVYKQYDLTLSTKQASKLMKYLNYEYSDIQPGYYYARACADETLNHRCRLAPFIDFIMSRSDLFMVVYQDEKAARQVANPQKKWTKNNDKYHAMDLGHEMGTGDGFNISAGLSGDGVLRSSDGKHVGYKKDTRKKANRQTAKPAAPARGRGGHSARGGRVGHGRGASRARGRGRGGGAGQPSAGAPVRQSGRKRTASARRKNAENNDDDDIDDSDDDCNDELNALAIRVGAVSVADDDFVDEDVEEDGDADIDDKVIRRGGRANVQVSKRAKTVAKASADASSKESSAEFNAVIGAMAKRATEIQRDNRVVVIVIDGARTHTTYSPTSPFSKPISAWTKVPTAKNNGQSVFSTYLGDDYDESMTREQLGQRVRQSARFLSEPLAVEEVAAQYGAFVLVLPNATPQWNPLEKLWRMASYHYSALPRSERTLKRLEEHWDAYLSEDSAICEPSKNIPKGMPMTHLEKWLFLAQQHVRWAAANPTSAKYPTEYHIMREQLPGPDIDQFTRKFGTRANLRANLASFGETCHSLNMYRRHPTSQDMWDTDLAKEMKF